MPWPARWSAGLISRAARLLGVLSALAGVLAFTPSRSAIAAEFAFDAFPASPIYKGKAKFPRFNGQDTGYKQYRTRIKQAQKAGPVFAGEYSVVQMGCGAGCSFGFIVSHKTGEIHDIPRGGENNMYMQLSYRASSRLLVTQWFSYDTSACVIEHLEWDGKDFSSRKVETIGALESCYSDISNHIPSH